MSRNILIKANIDLSEMPQEDAHTTILDVSDSGKESGVGLFGVFDGHGGKAVAKFVAKHMVLFQC